tara:strand:+ start:72 stop:815 length:744 start_codon:yes stop_codon:yes gene_type:complete
MTRPPRNPSAAIVIIGAEVLSAKVRDANGPYLLERLRAQGIDVIELRVIGDSIEVIAETVRALSARVDYLFTTGGIGPTHDDVTIGGIAQAFDREIIEHPFLVEKLEEHFGHTVDERVRSLCRVPDGTHVEMVRGKLPLFRYENVFILPGIPSLVEMCFEYLSPSLPSSTFVEHKLMVRVSESEIATHLARVQERYGSEVQIGSYPKKNEAGRYVEITVDGRDQALVDRALLHIQEGLREDWVIDVQ